MHELALTEGIVSFVLDLARKKGERVVGFTVAIGELAQFNRTLIEDLLPKLTKETELNDARVTVEVEKAVIRCLYCNSKLGFHTLIEPLPNNEKEMIHFLPELLSSFCKCPKCQMSDLQIESGRSIRVAEVEMDA